VPDSPAEPIPVLDLQPEIEARWEGLSAAAERVLRSGRFIGGPEVEAFEAEAAAYLDVPHAVAVNSGTDALVIGLRALGVSPGDEVVTSAFTFFATPESIGVVGAREVFVDVEADSGNIDPALIEAALTDRTRAIVPVHLFGRPADMDAIMDIAARRGLAVVEDCAQSFGARFGHGRYTGRQSGSIGHAGAFSFYPTKNLGGFGDGGLLATSDASVARRARVLRDHGADRRDDHHALGYNSRLDALQAALLRVKLPHLDAANEGRRAAAVRYDELLAGVPGVVTPEATPGHVFHQYTIRVAGGKRDAVREALTAAGIGSMVYYPVPCHRLPVYVDRGISLPVAERLAEEVLSLPVWPAIEAEAQERVRDVVASAVG
jgi:dTDP-4-amino-4,6-dideoxygalactose transaminase